MTLTVNPPLVFTGVSKVGVKAGEREDVVKLRTDPYVVPVELVEYIWK